MIQLSTLSYKKVVIIVNEVPKYKKPIIVVLISISILFAIYAGSRVGEPIGGFIYNLLH